MMKGQVNKKRKERLFQYRLILNFTGTKSKEEGNVTMRKVERKRVTQRGYEKDE